MSQSKAKLFIPKLITTEVLKEYLDLCDMLRKLEKRKDELRQSILHYYPDGGSVGIFLIFVESSTRRSFQIDEVKIQVDESTFRRFYEPFIRLTQSSKLIIKKLNNN